MTLTSIVLIIIAAALCVLVLAMIPTILTIRRTAESVGLLAEMLQKELKPTIQELTQVLAKIKIVSDDIAQHSNDVKSLMSALGETGNNLHAINRSVGVVTMAINTTSAWKTGATVALKFLIDRYFKKRGGK